MTKQPLSRARYTAYVIILICACILLYLFYIRDMRFFLVPSSSMLPTLQARDYILTLNANGYERGDLVVLEDPKDMNQYIVKRIVGLGGDEVMVRQGALFVNGSYVSEPYIREPYIEYQTAPYTVPENHVFLLGDNRNQSEDSSTWPDPGQPAERVVGRVQAIYLPFNRMQWVSPYPFTVLPEGDIGTGDEAAPEGGRE
ncbi:MAG: signal peptidase I [Candidatus Hydrogenedentota bacterium]